VTDLFGKPEEVTPEVQVDTPVDLRPDLSQWGIDEVDKGICEDTFENRAILRRARMNWLPVYAVNGVPTGHIQAISQEMQSQQRLLSLDEKRAILTDPNDKNSDYLSGYDLLAEAAGDLVAPPWVLGATKSWAKWNNQDPLLRGKRKEPHLPTRCKAIKDDGIRCQLWNNGRMEDEGFCRVHLGSLRQKPTDSVERARQRLTQATPAAVDVLEQLMESAESEPVKLKAATEILDRAGVRAGFDINTEVTIDVRPAASIIAERLGRLAEGARALEAKLNPEPEPVDAEVVEEVAKVEEK
jgi:hypothetical protein